MLIIVIAIIIISALTWNIHFYYVPSTGQDVSVGRFIVGCAFFIITPIFIFSFLTKQPGYKLDVANGEKIAFENVVQSIESVNISNNISGTISKTYFDKLGEIVKNADSNYQWFTNVNYKIFMKTVTDEVKMKELGMTPEEAEIFEILLISYDKYTATFVMKKVDDDYYLVDYNFLEETTVGYIFEII